MNIGPLIEAAREQFKTMAKSKQDKLRGLIMAYEGKDQSNGLFNALKEVLGK